MTDKMYCLVTKQLEDAFGDARTKTTVRWIKVQIENEALVPVKTSNVSADQQADWSSFSGELLPKTPTYIIYRLDSKNMQGHEWILVAYVPDGSSVRLIYYNLLKCTDTFFETFLGERQNVVRF